MKKKINNDKIKQKTKFISYILNIRTLYVILISIMIFLIFQILKHSKIPLKYYISPSWKALKKQVSVDIIDSQSDHVTTMNISFHEANKIYNSSLNDYPSQNGNSINQIHVQMNSYPRVLYMTPSYTMEQFHSLQRLLDSLLDVCNSGVNVTIHIESASELNYQHKKYTELSNRLYCHKLDYRIPLIVEHYGSKIGFGLNSRHRLVMKKYLYDFDYFIYSEEDMIFSSRHFYAYLHELNHIQSYFPESWKYYFIGFLRYTCIE